MPETSRECVVVLLDDTSFNVPVKPTLLASELLDMAASHCKVKEKDFFGLYTEGEGYKNWLELDKPILDPSQDLPKVTAQPVTIFFAFKYFVDDLRYFQDYMTVELLYRQSQQAIMKGDIVTDADTIFELAACTMQAQHGDYRNIEEARQHLRLLPVLPARLFNTVSVPHCESEVIKYYSMMLGIGRGEAIIKYLEIILSLPMYSMHYFEVKDKKDNMKWLGVGPDGICQCPYQDRSEPENRFQWLQLQNIYYRDRKFSMEVYQNPKPGKKGLGLGPVMVQAWYGSSSKVVMAIWKMARDQHVFYRSKRVKKAINLGMKFTEITRQLNKLHNTNVSPSSSHSSLSIDSARSSQTQASAEAVAAAKVAQQEMYTALLARRATLLAEFERKAARYKDILIKEMQITGIPPEGLTAEEIERMRKKFGVSYKFSKFVLDESTAGDQEVEDLEKQLEVQLSIIEASKNLLLQSQTRGMKKKRSKDIKQAEERLTKLEVKLNEVKKMKRGGGSNGSSKFHIGSPTTPNILQVPGSARRLTSTPTGTVDDTYIANLVFDTGATQGSSMNGLQKSPHHKSTSALNDLVSQSAHAPTSSSSTRLHVPVSASHSYLSYQQSKHSSVHSEHSLASDYSESPSYLSSFGFQDDFDLSPTSSVLSAHTTNVSQNRKWDDHRLRDFDLAEEYLQHLGRDQRDRRSPVVNPGAGSTGKPASQRHPAARPPAHASGQHFNYSSTSSPLSRHHRGSTPDMMLDHSGYQPRSSSPDPYLPAPDFLQYSSSYQPPSHMPQHLSGYPSGRSSATGHKASVGSAGSSCWYDNEFEYSGQDPSLHHHPPVSVAARPTSPRAKPRKASEESYDLQEMLRIWAESKQNPFGEGTLV